MNSSKPHPISGFASEADSEGGGVGAATAVAERLQGLGLVTSLKEVARSLDFYL
jgi:hypothetical protein